MQGKVLLTGGCGYIGAHCAVELAARGAEVVLLDNFSNSSRGVLPRLQAITGQAMPVHAVDLRDGTAVRRVLERERPDSVIHFAGLKAVGESVAEPLRYYDNNVGGTLSLLGAMADCGLRRLVFSSSATVYGDPDEVPIREDAPLRATNPYGRSKLMVEEILKDLAASEPGWQLMTLRYFNPVGAHGSGLIGEDPRGVPNNLVPFVAQVAVGRRDCLSIYGDDYPTADGTGVRDYIHVMDLAAGHAAALEGLDRVRGGAPLAVNLGTGRGYSVLEVVEAFRRASGRPIAAKVVARRPGDIACCYADPERARTLLGWEARLGLERMCEDAWRWQRENPEGFPAA
jgi:UDP-glucose 4-epimerase